jgi:hypothetical protein
MPDGSRSPTCLKYGALRGWGVIGSQKCLEGPYGNDSPAANLSGRKDFRGDVVLDSARGDAQHLSGVPDVYC